MLGQVARAVKFGISVGVGALAVVDRPGLCPAVLDADALVESVEGVRCHDCAARRHIGQPIPVVIAVTSRYVRRRIRLADRVPGVVIGVGVARRGRQLVVRACWGKLGVRGKLGVSSLSLGGKLGVSSLSLVRENSVSVHFPL
jgi:hypothetical protein